jgi:ribosomal protein S12 methylthiotransferase
VGIFAYSREENTKAYDLMRQISSKIKLDRLDRLLLLQQKISLEKNQCKIGKKMIVLVEGKSKANGYFGRSQAEAPEVDSIIYIKGDKIKIGDIVEVKITEALDYDLIGEKDSKML